MDSRKIIFKETAIVLWGQTICVAVMFGIYALLGRFGLHVLFGGLIGGALATLNFFFMAAGTSLAADKVQQQDVKGGQALVRISYLVRIVVLFIILFACAKSGSFDLIAMLLPLVFVRPIITVAEFFRKSGEKQV